MDVEELLDGSLQRRDARVRAALDLALREQAKPPLHLVQPRAVRRGEVQVVSRPLRQPRLDARRLVRRLVVQDNVHVHVGRYVSVDLLAR